MGIHDFYNLVKKYAPDQLNSYHLSEFFGHSFAIDVSIFLNKYIKSAGDKAWMGSFILFLCTLKKYGIKAVCIFDGPNPPIEKKREQQARRDAGKKAVDRLNRCKEIVTDLLRNYIPQNGVMKDAYKDECIKLYGKPTKNIRVIDWDDPCDILDALKELISRLEKQTLPVTNKHRETAKKIVKLMGVPYFQADGEAEALCAYLAIYGYVDEVLTEDTDVMAYGAPWLLAFKDYKLSDEKLFGIHLPSLREELGYTQEELRDLCILLGCDYNKRIKAYLPDANVDKNGPKYVNIGLEGAIKMIEEYRSLEVIEDYVEDIEPLNYRRCREIFTPPNNEEVQRLIQVVPYNKRPKFEKLADFIDENRISVKIEYIEKMWKPAKLTIIDADGSETENNMDNSVFQEEEINEKYNNFNDKENSEEEIIDEEVLGYTQNNQNHRDLHDDFDYLENALDSVIKIS